MDSEEVENIGLTKSLYEEIGEVITLEETTVDLIGSLERSDAWENDGGIPLETPFRKSKEQGDDDREGKTLAAGIAGSIGFWRC